MYRLRKKVDSIEKTPKKPSTIKYKDGAKNEYYYISEKNLL